ncbi:MAG: hydrogenase small subunit [Desulfobacteraceae bacterium]|nr:hydrogenase small subunit [Desulfobacteraceae bacterium]
MGISRRAFLKYCIGSSALLGLDALAVGKLSRVLAGTEQMATVIWLEGAGCSGCTISLTNLISATSDGGPQDVEDLLVNYINLSFAKTLMSAAGDQAVANLRAAQASGNYILVVEGGIPLAFNGMACTVGTENGSDITMEEMVQDLAGTAKAVVCVGACASFGGIPRSGPNPGNVQTVREVTGISTVNIPGCPPHPDWIAGTLASVLCGSMPAVDANGRPTAFFGTSVHNNCPKRPLYNLSHFATTFGQEGRCLRNLGCRGPETGADCALRGWNNGFNYCMQSNGNCIGCTESDYPRSKLVTRP